MKLTDDTFQSIYRGELWWELKAYGFNPSDWETEKFFRELAEIFYDTGYLDGSYDNEND